MNEWPEDWQSNCSVRIKLNALRMRKTFRKGSQAYHLIRVESFS